MEFYDFDFNRVLLPLGADFNGNLLYVSSSNGGFDYLVSVEDAKIPFGMAVSPGTVVMELYKIPEQLEVWLDQETLDCYSEKVKLFKGVTQSVLHDALYFHFVNGNLFLRGQVEFGPENYVNSLCRVLPDFFDDQGIDPEEQAEILAILLHVRPVG